MCIRDRRTVDLIGSSDDLTPSGERVAYGAFIQDLLRYQSWLEVIGALRYDGYSLGVFHEPGDSPKTPLDRRILARLVQDLEKVTRASGSVPGPSLEKQREALTRWMERQSKE